eukprot:1161517-Pelagomonas_calceolata.AAC.1
MHRCLANSFRKGYRHARRQPLRNIDGHYYNHIIQGLQPCLPAVDTGHIIQGLQSCLPAVDTGSPGLWHAGP